MKSHYRAVVIGGGVVGASVIYHLAKFGWTDVALVERSVLTAGSSWHAAGGFHALNANPNMAVLQAYTIDLLKEIEAESGQAIGMHMTGGIHVASAPERWEWLQANYRRFQAIGIDDVRLVTPDEIKTACPVIDIDGVLGGMWADREGYVDTTGTVWAYASAAKKRGAEVIEHNRVLELRHIRIRPGTSSPKRGRSAPSTWSTPRDYGPSRWAAWWDSSCRSRRSNTITLSPRRFPRSQR